jgi:Tfp pilus assembly protein PilF
MYPDACDFFQRTLSADPEEPGAWLGLGRAYDRQYMLEEAIWAVEQAFEVKPGHGVVRQELYRLYGQRDGNRIDEGHEPRERTQPILTRSALGRLYLRQSLYDKAIDELQAALHWDANKPGPHVALAEALWRAGQDLAASQVCLEILETLPNCLKANLILATIWLRSGNPRPAQSRLDVARALDPENLMAQEMMGPESPLPAVEVLVQAPDASQIAPMPTQPKSNRRSAGEETPIWVHELEELEDRATAPEAA